MKQDSETSGQSLSCSFRKSFPSPALRLLPSPELNLAKSAKATASPVTRVAAKRISIDHPFGMIRMKPTQLPNTKPNDRHFICCLIFISSLSVLSIPVFLFNPTRMLVNDRLDLTSASRFAHLLKQSSSYRLFPRRLGFYCRQRMHARSHILAKPGSVNKGEFRLCLECAP